MIAYNLEIFSKYKRVIYIFFYYEWVVFNLPMVIDGADGVPGQITGLLLVVKVLRRFSWNF